MDGSEQFAKDKRCGLFFHLQTAAYVISKEKFS